MRGTQSIISSSGPTVQLSDEVESCYCCGDAARKPKSLRISFVKHQPGFQHIDDAKQQRVYLCLHCAGGIAGSIVEFITDEVTKQKR